MSVHVGDYMRGKYLVFASVAVVLVCLVLFTSSYGVASISVSEGEQLRDKLEVKIFRGTIVSVTNTSVVVEGDEFSGELIARGMWIGVNESFIGRGSWIKVMGKVETKDSLIAMVSVEKNERTFNILLGLEQDGLTILRPRLFKVFHTKNYFAIYGEIISKGTNYMVIKNHDRKVVVVINPDSTWYKAGQGVVTWSEVSGEFKPGDVIRVFYHNILVLRKNFRDSFGINAILWGYSGAIIDLTSGTSLVRYLGE